jgi:hypothetical protein
MWNLGQLSRHGRPKVQLVPLDPRDIYPLTHGTGHAAGFRPGVAGRRTSVFDGRRVENVDDARPSAGKADKGDETVAPCPLAAVQTALRGPTVALSERGVLAVDH